MYAYTVKFRNSNPQISQTEEVLFKFNTHAIEKVVICKCMLYIYWSLRAE